MSETRWTPGPWEWDKAHDSVVAHIDPQFPTLIGDICMHTRGEANARLIAAAPDLYDALEAMKGVFDTPVLRRREANEYTQEARRIARRALAKARGEEL